MIKLDKTNYFVFYNVFSVSKEPEKRNNQFLTMLWFQQRYFFSMNS